THRHRFVLNALQNQTHHVRSNNEIFIYLTVPPPPIPTLFPYTTLFRSIIKLRKCSSKIITSILSFISGRLATKSNQIKERILVKIGRAVQQECRDRARMPSSA